MGKTKFLFTKIPFFKGIIINHSLTID